MAGICHKAVTCNALCEQFKMADNRKLIDVKQHFSFVNESIHHQRIALLDWKIGNSCKLISKAKYVPGNYFSVLLF